MMLMCTGGETTIVPEAVVNRAVKLCVPPDRLVARRVNGERASSASLVSKSQNSIFAGNSVAAALMKILAGARKDVPSAGVTMRAAGAVTVTCLYLRSAPANTKKISPCGSRAASGEGVIYIPADKVCPAALALHRIGPS